MPLQPPQYLGNLDSTNPRGTDSRTISDDVHRNTKESSRMSFPAVTGEVTSTHGDLNLLSGFAAASRKVMTGTGGTTVALFVNPTAPTGWTIVTTFDERAIVVKGTLNGTVTAGGDVAGTDDPALMDKVPTHTHPVVTPAHSHRFVTNIGSTGALGPDDALAASRAAGNNSDYLVAGGGAHTSSTIGRTNTPIDEGTGVTDANTGAVNYVPKIAAVIACQLDA